MTTRLRALFVVPAAVVIVGFSFGPIVAHLAAGRIRATAAARGLTVSWRKLALSGLGRVSLSRVVAVRARADSAPDTLFRADSAAVAPDLDLSMTRRAIEALRAVGAATDDPAIALARGFVERCRAPNGGFVYSPVEDALNKGERTDAIAQGYGSATTDGILALLACGATATDPLVADALKWLHTNHRTDANPGIGPGPLEGFARAMRFYYRAGAAAVFAALGGPDGWREGLVEATLAEQREDGSFANSEPLQKEDDPLIATSFAIQALAV